MFLPILRKQCLGSEWTGMGILPWQCVLSWSEGKVTVTKESKLWKRSYNWWNVKSVFGWCALQWWMANWGWGIKCIESKHSRIKVIGNRNHWYSSDSLWCIKSIDHQTEQIRNVGSDQWNRSVWLCVMAAHQHRGRVAEGLMKHGEDDVLWCSKGQGWGSSGLKITCCSELNIRSPAWVGGPQQRKAAAWLKQRDQKVQVFLSLKTS